MHSSMQDWFPDKMNNLLKLQITLDIKEIKDESNLTVSLLEGKNQKYQYCHGNSSLERPYAGSQVEEEN